MKVGFLGLGKLGLPVALAVESKGHEVFGTDISTNTIKNIKDKKIDYKELWVDDYLKKTKLKICCLKDLVKNSEIIFVPIQTPHDPAYEGITKIPKKRADFDYKFLIKGIKNLSDEIEKQKIDKVVIIISTVLPGTIRQKIKPLIGLHTKLCYNPFFIAMGTTMKDFLEPEFILFGVDDAEAAKKTENFYRTINNSIFYKTTIENAELIKVCYNTYISTKIAFINTIMEMCHKLPGTNIDDVSNALALGSRRLMSSAYLKGGMGDGGGCHPRDNIALSWLAKKLKISFDFFEKIMIQREKQTEWYVKLIKKLKKKNDKIYILGKSFKPETNITTGSPSLLLFNLLNKKNEKIIIYDPYIDRKKPKFEKGIYFIGTKHELFRKFKFPNGSTIIDPFRMINENTKIKLIKIGDNY
jgi:UDPglucose 6-dehydrogenase